ncbi:MAG: winged helix-turn-helix domain-containing protein [Pseudomonadota bacterium]
MNYTVELMDDVRFLDFVFNDQLRRLTKGDADVAIGARAFDLLSHLIANRDRVVSRDEVMAAVWPDAMVGDNNLNVQVANLRLALGANAIATVPGRGLRFALNVETDLLIPEIAERSSVVVLPFSNYCGDAKLDWIADSVVEDITTELSRFRDLFVVARNSAVAYLDMPRDLRKITRELGVRYVVEGSIRISSDMLRVTVQLIDATSGNQIWAESFKANLADQLETEERIVRRIVTSLAPWIDRAEAKRVQRTAPEDLAAHGIARKGWAIISGGEMTYDPVPRNSAREHARKALALDPQNGLAWRVLAWVGWWNVYHGTTGSMPASLAESIEAATRAIAVDQTDHHARRLRALLHFMNQDSENGLPELRQAHQMNPNCAVTLAWLGLYEGFYGDPSRGVPLVEAALRRSPRDPAKGSLLAALGFAQFTVRDYRSAVQTAQSALAESASSATPLIILSIAFVGLGQIDQAKSAYARVAEIAPSLVEARLAGKWLSTNPDYVGRADLFFRIAAGLDAAEAAEELL